MTFDPTRNAISSPEGASGPSLPAWQDGQTTDLFGPVPAPASRSRSRAKEAVPTTLGICGPTSFASSVPSGPLSSWESRLRERLAMVGSTECALIWRAKDTPAGASISRLAPWTPPISDSGSTGSHWPTPKGSNAGPDFAKVERSATGMSLQTVMAAQSYWPTPKASAAGETSRSGARKDEPLMGGLMRNAHWSTPRASDGEKGGPNQSFGAGGQPLPAQMHQATWAAATKIDATGRGYQMSGGRKFLSLPGQMDRRLSGPIAQTEAGGPTTNGSPATTAKRGAPNPAFPCWLMGFPAEWVSGAWRAMQSRPSSRRKSSAR